MEALLNQNIIFSACMIWGQTHPFVDGKNGANRSQAVDVTGAIERVETDHVLSLWQSKIQEVTK